MPLHPLLARARPAPVVIKTCALLLVYVLWLVSLPFIESPEQLAFQLSEAGFFENASILLWIIAASVPMMHIRRHRFNGPAYSLLFLLFAAREAEWHKAFTADSMLKSAYYFRGDFTTEKAIAAVFAVAIIALITTLMLQMLRYLFRQGGLFQPSGQLLALSWGILVFSKIIDRFPADFRHTYGYPLPELTYNILQVLEEGLEMIMPVVFMLALLITPNIITHARTRMAATRITEGAAPTKSV